jgi:hypothetical protein
MPARENPQMESVAVGLRHWSQDRNDAERFDQFDSAVYFRDKAIALRERRGVGVVKFS